MMTPRWNGHSAIANSLESLNRKSTKKCPSPPNPIRPIVLHNTSHLSLLVAPHRPHRQYHQHPHQLPHSPPPPHNHSPLQPSKTHFPSSIFSFVFLFANFQK